MKTIKSIHVAESESVIYYQDGEYRANLAIPISDLSIEQNAIRQAALDWFVGQLAQGETLAGNIILDIRRNAILVDAGDNEADPPVLPTYRHEVIGVATVQSPLGQRTISRSSETMPTELREGFLALLAGIEERINQPQN
jgi:hypothetical protein